MAKKMIGWHVVELLVAAVLLWYDTRVFLFYAFMNLLKVSHQVNHLRACVRAATRATMQSCSPCLNTSG